MKRLTGHNLIMDAQSQRRSSHSCLVSLRSNQASEATRTFFMLLILMTHSNAIYPLCRNTFHTLHMFHRWRVWKVWKVYRHVNQRLSEVHSLVFTILLMILVEYFYLLLIAWFAKLDILISSLGTQMDTYIKTMVTIITVCVVVLTLDKLAK